MNEFVKIPNYGLLKIDRVIFEAAYPILFTCLNEKSELFLSVCCQNNDKGKKWLISKTSSNTIIKMLKDEMTIRDAFLADPDCRITVNRCKDETDVCFDNEEDWSENSIYLPKKGEYLEADPDEFCDEIAYYQREKAISYTENYRDMMSIKGEAKEDSELVLDEFSLVEMNVKTIYTEVMQIMKALEQLHLDMIQKIAFEYEVDHYFKELHSFGLEEVEVQKVELNENMATELLTAA